MSTALDRVRARWAGHPRHDINGYVSYWTKQKHTNYEHRLVMEELLGRKLERGEIVHHKNKKRWDNRDSNLELTTHKEHNRHHAEEKGGGIAVILCPCGRKVERRLSWVKKAKHHFCSPRCFQIWCRRVKRPDISVLIKMVKRTSIAVVARKYGVSWNAVKKWITRSKL